MSFSSAVFTSEGLSLLPMNPKTDPLLFFSILTNIHGRAKR